MVCPLAAQREMFLMHLSKLSTGALLLWDRRRALRTNLLIYILLVFNPAHVWNIWARSHVKAICVKSCDHQTRNVCAFAAHSFYKTHENSSSLDLIISRARVSFSLTRVFRSLPPQNWRPRWCMQSFLSLLTNSLSRRHHNTNDHHYLSAAPRENYNARHFFRRTLLLLLVCSWEMFVITGH